MKPRSSSAKTSNAIDPKPVTLAAVQLRCHPAFQIGARDYLAQPYIPDSGIPPLWAISEVQLGFEIEDLKTRCEEDYLKWNEMRLHGIRRWFKEQGLTDDVIIVFPEGSVPRQHLGLLEKWSREESVVILGGTHSFSADDRALPDYLSLNLIPQITTEQSADYIFRLPDQQRLERLEPMFSELRAVPELLTAQEVKAFELARQKLEWGELSTCREFRAKLDKLAEIWRIRDKPFASKSVLPVFDSEGVRFRAKTALSPFERLGLEALDEEVERPEVIQVSLHDRKIPILPLVCSEALQTHPNVEKDYAVCAIVSYNPGGNRHFLPIMDWTTARRVPTVYCNDGRFGGSKISQLMDNRSAAESRWMELPEGDGILVVETVPGAAAQVGTNRPVATHRLLKVAAIVAGDGGETACRVAKELARLLSEAGAGRNVSRELRELGETEKPTQIQRRNVDYLYDLCVNGTASKDQWDIHATDCVFNSRGQGGAGVPVGRTQSLENLERGLARSVLSRLEYLCGLPNAAQYAPALMRIRSECLTVVDRSLSSSLLENVLARIEKVGAEASAETQKRLNHKLGSIVERYGGTSGWIFLVRGKVSENPTTIDQAIKLHTLKSASGTAFGAFTPSLADEAAEGSDKASISLVPKIIHNAPEHGARLSLGEGVSGTVALRGSGYLNNAIADKHRRSMDPHHVPVIHGSRSILSVPIFMLTPSGESDREGETPHVSMDLPERRLIGVLTLEGNTQAAFLPIDVGRLQAEAANLSADLLILAASTVVRRSTLVWHPAVHGWEVSRVLEQFCYAIATGVPGASDRPAVGATLWYGDYSRKVLYVRATTRFDFEYQDTRTLPFQSFTGRVLTEKPKIWQTRSDSDGFLRKVKAARMEMERVKACPFMAYGDHRATGVLSLYLFRQTHRLTGQMIDASIGDMVLSRLASYAGRFFRDLQVLKRHFLLAEIKGILRSSSWPGTGVFDVLRNLVESAFEADGCTILRLDPDGKELKVMSTSGLYDRTGNPRTETVRAQLGPPTKTRITTIDPANGDIAERTLSVYKGLTAYAVSRPDTPVRKLDVHDRFEIMGEFSSKDVLLSVVPRGPLVERGIPKAKRANRLLCSAIRSGRDDSGRPSRVLGAIRVVRAADKVPFIEEDAVVLSDVASMIGALMAQADRIPNKQDEYVTPITWNDQFIQHVFDQILHSKRRQSDKTGPLLVSLRFAVGTRNSTSELRRCQIRSRWTTAPPDEHEDLPITQEEGSIGWTAIDDRRIVYYTKDGAEEVWRPIHRDSVHIRSGICVPMYWFANGHDSKGVLSVDFLDSGPPDEGILRAIMIQALRLGRLVDPNATEVSLLDDQDPVDGAVALANSLPSVRIARAELAPYAPTEHIRDGEYTRHMVRTHFGVEMLKYGIRWSRTRFALPLWLGMSIHCWVVGEICPQEHLKEEELEEYVSHLLSQISAEWHVRVSKLAGSSGKLRIRFREEPVAVVGCRGWAVDVSFVRRGQERAASGASGR